MNRLLAWTVGFCAVITIIIAAGCQTPGTFPKPDARWQTHAGQLQYVSGDKSVIGDMVMRSLGTNELQLDFQSGPGFPLIELKQSGDRVRAEGILARGTWEGHAGRAPEHLRGWVRLREKLAGKSPRGRLSVEPVAGERFTFVFAR